MNKLKKLKERYFRPVIAHPDGHLGHHADCNIYCPEYQHCSCGLIHDLNIIDYADKLYGKYHEDYRTSLNLIKPTEEQIKETEKHLKEIFGDRFIEGDPEENFKEIESEWNAIEEVFGKEFRQRREKEWATQSEKI